jgi:hypothetical protein
VVVSVEADIETDVESKFTPGDIYAGAKTRNAA